MLKLCINTLSILNTTIVNKKLTERESEKEKEREKERVLGYYTQGTHYP